MRILVVDDSEDWRDLTEAALLAAGYDVSLAASAADAYTALGIAGDKADPIDLVILDVLMPGIDGVEACARIRRDSRHADTPIIMVTTLHDMDSLSNAFVAGATDYISKPFDRVELLARVRSALKLKAELDRRKAREQELISLARLTYGEPQGERFIDETTGLFCGEAAEAYLSAAAGNDASKAMSVLALAIDRIEALRAAQGEDARREVLARVAHAVRLATAPIGVTAAAYRDGIIVLVAPELDGSGAHTLAEILRAAVWRLRLPNSESIVSDVVTASIGIVTGRTGRGPGRAALLADARAHAKQAAAAGGNRVAAVDLSAA